MSLSLIILAAGLGSRFGGNKPMAEVGPNGQSLFEYSVHDAFNAGFRHVVFVVNENQDTAEFSSRLQQYADKLKVEFVVQSITANVTQGKNALYSARSKPWGTAHAVLVCREYINNPFLVINADDYYGQENYKQVANYLLANSANPQTCVMPGYQLGNTLSSSGGVNRGICNVGSDGFLESIEEFKNIVLDQHGFSFDDQSNESVCINSASIVSMTCWGFVPSIFDLLENEFQQFLSSTSAVANDEFYIPNAVNIGIRAGLLKVKVFDTSEIWKGLTYAADLAIVKNYISTLTKAGLYSDMR